MTPITKEWTDKAEGDFHTASREPEVLESLYRYLEEQLKDVDFVVDGVEIKKPRRGGASRESVSRWSRETSSGKKIERPLEGLIIPLAIF